MVNNYAIQDILTHFSENNVNILPYILDQLKKEQTLFSIEFVTTNKYFGMVKGDILIMSKFTFDYLLLILNFMNYTYELSIPYGQLTDYSEFHLILKKEWG